MRDLLLSISILPANRLILDSLYSGGICRSLRQALRSVFLRYNHENYDQTTQRSTILISVRIATIELDGKPVTVDTRKAFALLAYLAITRQAHSRDALAALLWPEYDQSPRLCRIAPHLVRAQQSDRADMALRSSAKRSGWTDQAGVWIDVEQFQQHLECLRQHGHADSEVCARCVEPLTQAAELYREDFLAGFSLRDSGDFDDWSFFQAEHSAPRIDGALDRLVRLLACSMTMQPPSRRRAAGSRSIPCMNPRTVS